MHSSAASIKLAATRISNQIFNLLRFQAAKNLRIPWIEHDVNEEVMNNSRQLKLLNCIMTAWGREHYRIQQRETHRKGKNRFSFMKGFVSERYNHSKSINSNTMGCNAPLHISSV